MNMRNCVVKKDSAFMLFATQNIDLSGSYKNLLLWSKFIDSFHYDDEVVRNLVFIEHPNEFYVGLSIRSEDTALLEKKLKRYSEGLAYLLIYHFPEANTRVLEQDETLNVITNILNLNQIPEKLTSLSGERLSETNKKGLKILFVRAIDPKIVFEKLFEFYKEDHKQKRISIERRVGVKPKYDERILTVLQNPTTAYSFSYFPSKEELNEKIEKVEGVCELPEDDFVNQFLDTMGVPDKLIDLVYSAQSTSDLFDNPYVSLASPEKVAELILNDK